MLLVARKPRTGSSSDPVAGTAKVVSIGKYSVSFGSQDAKVIGTKAYHVNEQPDASELLAGAKQVGASLGLIGHERS